MQGFDRPFAAALAETAQALATYAEGRAKEAMLAGIEADVAGYQLR